MHVAVERLRSRVTRYHGDFPYTNVHDWREKTIACWGPYASKSDAETALHMRGWQKDAGGVWNIDVTKTTGDELCGIAEVLEVKSRA